MQSAELGLASIVEVLHLALNVTATRTLGVTSVLDRLDHELTNTVILNRGFVAVVVSYNAIGQLALEVFVGHSMEGMVELVVDADIGGGSGVFHNEVIIL